MAKGRMLLCIFPFCWSADFRSSNFTSERTLFTRVFGKLLTHRHDLNCLIVSSKVVSEELV